MVREELKAEIKQTIIKRWGVKDIKDLNPGQSSCLYKILSDSIKLKIFNTTRSLLNTKKFMESLYIIFYGIQIKQCCPECGIGLRFNSYIKGYNTFCCSYCSNKSKKTKKKIKQSNIVKYGGHPTKTKVVQEKRIQTTIDRYGVTNVSKLQEVKNKREVTMMVKYGIHHPMYSDEFKTKQKNTTFKHYGVDHPLQSPDLLAKSQNTCLKNYGVCSPMQNKLLKQKAEKTNLKNLGVKYAFMQENIRDELVKANQRKTIKKYLTNKSLCFSLSDPMFTQEDYIGLDYGYLFMCKKCSKLFYDQFNWQHPAKCPICYRRNIGTSFAEQEIANYIKSSYPNLEIITNTRKIISPKELDIYIPEKKLAIEFNGDYWHSTKYAGETSHLNKTNLCEDQGIKLIQIMEHEWSNNKEWWINFIKANIENKINLKLTHKTIFNRFKYSILDFIDKELALIKPTLIKDVQYPFYNSGHIQLQGQI